MHLFGLLLAFSALAASAQTQSAPPAIKTAASVVLQAAPDQAQVEIGVATQARTAQEAASQNAVQMQNAITQVKAAAGPKVDTRTTRYTLNPTYVPPKVNGGKPAIDGYTAVNTLVLTCTDLSIVGKAIDAATSGGANEIQSLQFSLKDETPVRARALRQAALEARANAESMAAALGLKLGKVLLLEQGGSPSVIRPMPMAASARIAGVPTPIETGTVSVEATVTLTIAIEQ